MTACPSTIDPSIIAEKSLPSTLTTPKPSKLDDLLDDTSSASDDDTDQPLFQFKIANPDTFSGNNAKNKHRVSYVEKNSVDLPASKPHSYSSTKTEKETPQEKQQQQQQYRDDDLKNIRHSFTSMPLSRRQSKTLESDSSSPTKHHRNTFHTLPEVVEYQPHSSSASVFEPLVTATRKKLQIGSAPPEPPTLNNTISPPALAKPPFAPLLPTMAGTNQSHDARYPAPSTPLYNNVSSYDKTLTINNTNTENLGGQQQQQQQQQHDYHDGDTNSYYDTTTNSYEYAASFSAMSPTLSQTPTTTTTTTTTTTDSLRNSIGNNRSHLSKYNHASYSLTNRPDALKLYRQMAEKTQDEKVQLSYAKYLFEVAALYQPQQQSDSGNSSNRSEEEKRKALEQEGVRWIRRLAKTGVGEAAFLQARWMETQQYGFKTPKQAHKIDRHYLVAAQAGVPEACYYLAVRQEAAGVAPLQETFRLYQKSADLKCVQAIYKMAKIYLHGELGQHQHLVKGMNYLFSAVNHSTTECHEPPYVLALILTNKYSRLVVPSELLQTYGDTVTHVVEYMEQASKLGNIGAKNRSGHIYEHGLYGVHMNMSKAFRYYQEVVNKGQHLQSMLGLSRLYNGGCHGPNDNDEQLRLDNDVSGWLVSTPKDEDQSFYWCQRAAKGDLPDALYLLGWYYEIGWGVPRNYQYSLECYQRAAGKGQLDAKARLENRHSFTRHQHEEVLGNRENVIQLDRGADGRSSGSNGKTGDDCIVM